MAASTVAQAVAHPPFFASRNSSLLVLSSQLLPVAIISFVGPTFYVIIGDGFTAAIGGLIGT